jgi:hypothetical protein
MSGPFLSAGVFYGPVSNIDSSQLHELGSMRWDAGRILQYVKFGGNPAAYEWVQGDTAQFTQAYQVIQLAASVTQTPLGVAEFGGSNGSFGWITRLGPATAKVATTAFAGSELRPGGTAGTLGPIWTTAPTQFGGYGIAVATGVAAGSLVNVRCL